MGMNDFSFRIQDSSAWQVKIQAKLSVFIFIVVTLS